VFSDSNDLSLQQSPTTSTCQWTPAWLPIVRLDRVQVPILPAVPLAMRLTTIQGKRALATGSANGIAHQAVTVNTKIPSESIKAEHLQTHLFLVNL
jgi:hypothetical protein